MNEERKSGSKGMEIAIDPLTIGKTCNLHTNPEEQEGVPPIFQ
jgi:hypothetical protein